MKPQEEIKNATGVPSAGKSIWAQVCVGGVALLVLTFFVGYQMGRNAGSPATSAAPQTNMAAAVMLVEHTHQETRGWMNLPAGAIVTDGTTFVIGGAIRTAGLRAYRDGKRYPGAVLDVPINRKGSRIHLLHAAENVWNTPEGTPYVRVVFHYANGKTHETELLIGVHGRDWFRGPSDPEVLVKDENSSVVWTQSRPNGVTLRMYRTTLEHPYPDSVITSADVVSPLHGPNVLLFGITVDNDNRPLAEPYEPMQGSVPANQTMAFDIQDAAGRPLEKATMAWVAVAKRGRVEFPAFRADEQGRVKLTVPAEGFVEIAYTVFGLSNRFLQGSVPADNAGAFPATQVITFTPENTQDGQTGRPAINTGTR